MICHWLTANQPLYEPSSIIAIITRHYQASSAKITNLKGSWRNRGPAQRPASDLPDLRGTVGAAAAQGAWSKFLAAKAIIATHHLLEDPGLEAGFRSTGYATQRGNVG